MSRSMQLNTLISQVEQLPREEQLTLLQKLSLLLKGNSTQPKSVSKLSALCRKVFLDTAPLIYFIDGHSSYQTLLLQLFSSAEKGVFTFVTSSVTLLEVLVKPLREGRADLAFQYKEILTSAAGMELLEVTTNIAARAALLRATYTLKTPDAIQIATALEAKADYFLTNDIRLKNITEVPVICLGEIHF